MVLGLASLISGGAKFVSGLAQGGGFGVGYGFGVRLGYDIYGQIKGQLGLGKPDVKTPATNAARYSNNPLMSHLGSGVEMGLNQVLK